MVFNELYVFGLSMKFDDACVLQWDSMIMRNLNEVCFLSFFIHFSLSFPIMTRNIFRLK